MSDITRQLPLTEIEIYKALEKLSLTTLRY